MGWRGNMYDFSPINYRLFRYEATKMAFLAE